MSQNSESSNSSKSGFNREFLPGLILGLVVGLPVGFVASEMFDTSPGIKRASPETDPAATNRRRDTSDRESTPEVTPPDTIPVDPNAGG